MNEYIRWLLIWAYLKLRHIIIDERNNMNKYRSELEGGGGRLWARPQTETGGVGPRTLVNKVLPVNEVSLAPRPQLYAARTSLWVG